MEIDYQSEFGITPEVISVIEPMAQCLHFNTKSMQTSEYQAEAGADFARLCWLLFAGLDKEQPGVVGGFGMLTTEK